jgi:hypothetical protein
MQNFAGPKLVTCNAHMYIVRNIFDSWQLLKGFFNHPVYNRCNSNSCTVSYIFCQPGALWIPSFFLCRQSYTDFFSNFHMPPPLHTIQANQARKKREGKGPNVSWLSFWQKRNQYNDLTVIFSNTGAIPYSNLLILIFSCSWGWALCYSIYIMVKLISAGWTLPARSAKKVEKNLGLQA